MELSPRAKLMREWILNEWTDKLGMILESMADEKPGFERRGAGNGETVPSADVIVWEQQYSTFENPVIWIGVPASTAVDLGGRMLRASGIDDVEESDAQSTFAEILNQSLGAIGEALGSHLNREVVAGDGQHLQSIPEDLDWVPVRMQFKSGSPESVWFGTSVEFLDALAVGAVRNAAAEGASAGSEQTEAAPAQRDDSPVLSIGSKTFELLLDVALPVSISFGRALLPVKEVLKLTTGSIVELDRTVAEPVDVIVNNCVIARGEVVVVEGNYGVRILQIASRFERLRTGSGSTAVKHAMVRS